MLILSQLRAPGTAACALAALSVLGPATAHAQSGALQVEQLEPLPAGSGILNVATSDVLPEGAWAVDAWVGYSVDPLHLSPSSDQDQRTDGSVLPAQLRTELIAAYGLFGLGEIAVAAPVTMLLGEGDYGIAGRTPADLQGTATGDVRVVLAADMGALWSGLADLAPGFGLGAGLAVWLPTGDTDKFAGEGELRFEPRLFGDWGDDGGWRAAANVAYHVRPEQKVFSYVHDDVIRWSTALSAPSGVHALEGLAVVHGALVLADQPDPTDATRTVSGSIYNPVEVLGGARYGLPFDAEVTVALGTGLTSGIGAPTFRAMTQVGFGLPHDRGRQPSWAAVRDSDRDELSDLHDDCPFDAENRDGRRDHDGCPEAGAEVFAMLKFDAAPVRKPVKAKAQTESEDPPKTPPPTEAAAAFIPTAEDLPTLPELTQFKDADQDGIADAEDECPNEAEDEDGFQDYDGCPDPDDDLDGIADADDKCRFEAETHNDFEDEDGCPEVGPDADGDGIGDYYDVCPNEAETRNGIRDADGCPEADEEELLAQIALWDRLPAPPPPPAPVFAVATPVAAAPARDWLSDKLPTLVAVGDRDGDGIDDEDDDCVDDIGGEGEGEAADDPELPDQDRDGVADVDDNCPFLANSDQADEDGDQIGDRCDFQTGEEEEEVDVQGMRLGGRACGVSVSTPASAAAPSDLPSLAPWRRR